MSTQKITEFRAEKFIQELFKSKEVDLLDDFSKSCDIKSIFLTGKENAIMNRKYSADPNKIITCTQLAIESNPSTDCIRQIVQKSFIKFCDDKILKLITEGSHSVEIKSVSYYNNQILNGENPDIVYKGDN